MAIDVFFPHNGRGPWAPIAVGHARTHFDKVHDLCDMDSFSTPEWELFVSRYQHFSVNPEYFELVCIKRYFYCRTYAENAGLSSFLMLDTDLLVFPGLENYIDRVTNGSRVGLSGGAAENGQAPHLSPHCSHWTLEAVIAFTNWLPKYAEQSEVVASRYAKTGQFPLQLSDMTLLADWVREESVPFVDLAVANGQDCIDHNIMVAQQGGQVFENILGVKRIRISSTGPTCRDGSKDEVRFLALHFQGKAKGAMKLVSEGSVLRALVYLVAVKLARLARSAIK